jgi:hypothetical protein
MLGVPAELLRHPGPLDDAQRAWSRTRPRRSLAARLLPSGNWLAEACAAITNASTAPAIPTGSAQFQIARADALLAVCDTYAAMCCPRPYRPTRETRTALADTASAEQGCSTGTWRNGCCTVLLPCWLHGRVGGRRGWRGRGSARRLARPGNALAAGGEPSDRHPGFLAIPQTLDLAVCDGRSIVRTLSAEDRRSLLGRRHPELI